MKVALITDTHYGVRNDHPAFQSNLKKSLDWFFHILDVRGIKHCIHLGDLFDRRKYINYVTARLCRETFLQPLRDRGIETHIIAGNHDQYYRNTHDVNALQEIIGDRYENIHTYATPAMISMGSLDIQLIPWITDSNSKESYAAIKNARTDILMGHFEIVGFEMYRGHVCDHGLSVGLFDRYSWVYSGHYHHRSVSGNVHYLGAFGEYTWSDYDDSRGFHILDTETRELEYLVNPHPIHKMLAYDDVKYPDIMQITEFDKCKDAFIKVVCGSKQDLFKFEQFIDTLYKAGPLDISIVEDANAIQDLSEEEIIDEAEDTATTLKKYIEGLKLPVDTAIMNNFMQDVLKEALAGEESN